MKTGVSSYSYSQAVKNGRMSEKDTIKKSAELGFDVIEFAGLTPPDGTDTESYAREIKALCDESGMTMGNYTIGADFLYGSEGHWEAEVERLKQEVNIARILGAPGMRHDATRGYKPDDTGAKGFDNALPVLIKGCRAVTEYAESQGIKTMVENHGFFCQDSERVEKLVCGVNHKNFGLLVDVGNFLCADESPAQAVGRLMPYAFHVHMKDFHVKPGNGPNPGTGWFCSRGGNFLRGSIIGHGEVPLLQCLRIISKSGYNGTLSIEFEGMEDALTGITVGLENLKNLIKLI